MTNSKRIVHMYYDLPNPQHRKMYVICNLIATMNTFIIGDGIFSPNFLCVNDVPLKFKTTYLNNFVN